MDSFTLSFAQQRLWFLDQLVPGSSLYNVPQAYRLKGALDPSVLELALLQIASRHETLRTTFGSVEGSPVQKIHPEPSLTLELIDLSHLPEAERAAQAERTVSEKATIPFDLERGPLVRASLLRLSEQEHILALILHHIVFDGWSSQVLLKELAALYPALLEAKPSPLNPIEIQYADFSVWQRKWLQGEVLEKQLSYWTEHLKAAPAAIELPTDRPRPPVQTHHGAVHRFTFSSELTEGLKSLARSGSATLFMALLAGFDALLSRYSSQRDIVVGVPVAGRNRTEIEGLIGFFVNTLPLRCDLSGDPDFRELIARVRHAALGAYSHEDLPFEKLVEELRPERDLSRHPVFQAMFQLQTSTELLSFAGIELEQFRAEWSLSKFDLSLHVLDRGEELQAAFEYSTDLFEPETIERMASHLKVLLQSAVAHPDLPLSKLPLLTEQERHQILYEWNDTEVQFSRDRCVHQLFEEQVEKNPDALAVVFEDEELSYFELNLRANQLAHHLIELGVGAETLVGICVERSIDMVVDLLGILKAGGAYVPLDPSYPQQRLAFMLQDTSAPVLISQQDLLSKLPDYQGHLVLLDADKYAIGKQPTVNPDSKATSDNLAYVIYTSGSTGRPKGVMVEHKSLVNLATWHQSSYRLTTEERCTQVASLSFDACTWETFAPLISGSSVWVLGESARLDAGHIVEWLTSNKITSTFLPTPMAETIIPLWSRRDGTLRHLLTGGDRLNSRPSESLPFTTVNHYGPTESTVVATAGLVAPQGPEDSAPTIGRPIYNTRIYILDEMMNPVPVGVAGEIYIGGEGVARGYLNRPGLTAERFIEDPFVDDRAARLYRTGDLARYLPDGNIEFVGRADHQVKIRGFRVELGEIEATLLEHPQVKGAVVLAREDVPGDKRLVAYVVADQGSATSAFELRAHLKAKLPDYMVPLAYVELEALPLTPNGKVDRDALPAPETSRPDQHTPFVAPRNPLEELIAGIFADVLGVHQVGIHDDFFELGGHSLLATRVIAAIHHRLGRKIKLSQLFVNSTVSELAQLIKNMRHDSALGPMFGR